MAKKPKSAWPSTTASTDLPAVSNTTSAKGTASSRASSVARSTETPHGRPSSPRLARMGLPRLMDARSVPVGAKAVRTASGVMGCFRQMGIEPSVPETRCGLSCLEAPARRGPVDATIQVVAEQRILIRGRQVTECRVEGAPAVALLVPADGMEAAHAPPCPVLDDGRLVGALVHRQKVMQLRRFGRVEFVPLFREQVAGGAELHAGEVGVFHFQHGRLHGRMGVEHVAGQLAVPWPAVFRIRGAVHADVAATGTDRSEE